MFYLHITETFQKLRVKETLQAPFLWMLFLISLVFLERDSSLTLKKGSSFPSLSWVGLHLLLKSASGLENPVTGVISASRMKLPKWEKSTKRDLHESSFLSSEVEIGEEGRLGCTACLALNCSACRDLKIIRGGLVQPEIFNRIEWFIFFRIISLPNEFNFPFLLNIWDRVLAIPVEKNSPCASNFSTSWSTSVFFFSLIIFATKKGQ